MKNEKMKTEKTKAVTEQRGGIVSVACHTPKFKYPLTFQLKAQGDG